MKLDAQKSFSLCKNTVSPFLITIEDIIFLLWELNHEVIIKDLVDASEDHLENFDIKHIM